MTKLEELKAVVDAAGAAAAKATRGDAADLVAALDEAVAAYQDERKKQQEVTPMPCPFWWRKPRLTKGTREMHGDLDQSHRFYCQARIAELEALLLRAESTIEKSWVTIYPDMEEDFNMDGSWDVVKDIRAVLKGKDT